MRRTLAAVAIAALAVIPFGTTAASATCGGGQPGEPCYCPEYPLFEKLGIGFNC
ncbi:MAG TPA: hypothetical protein VNQ77_00275 [Frankiaceae bacterium]|nr:hypothetical protein [Frankiaceae bacterium]